MDSSFGDLAAAHPPTTPQAYFTAAGATTPTPVVMMTAQQPQCGLCMYHHHHYHNHQGIVFYPATAASPMRRQICVRTETAGSSNLEVDSNCNNDEARGYYKQPREEAEEEDSRAGIAANDSGESINGNDDDDDPFCVVDRDREQAGWRRPPKHYSGYCSRRIQSKSEPTMAVSESLPGM